MTEHSPEQVTSETTGNPVTKIKYRSDFDVTLIDVMGGDERICQAARVSQQGAAAADTAESGALIGFLMKNRHGSPFEHGSLTWLISAPIFVWREFHRHRIASYNEESSRWKQLEPVFYVPAPNRPAFKAEGSRTGDYKNVAAQTNDQARTFAEYAGALAVNQEKAYRAYEAALASGVAREIARFGLPVSIYSSCYVTMNPRALMNFLSLRTADTALYEIRQVANAMATDFEHTFPLTAEAFSLAGRVAP